MRHKHKAVVIMMAGVLGMTGCSGEEERVLQDPGKAKKVIDYTAFKETDLLLQTEAVTEKQTEPVTEKITEKVTEKQTETETEKMIREYDGKYDFSDEFLLRAVLLAAENEDPSTFEDQTKISLSDSLQVRMIRIGPLVIKAEGTNGGMYGTVEAVSTDQNLLCAFLKAIGVAEDEEAYQRILEGLCDGENAGLAGLQDLYRYMDEEGVHLVMTRIMHEGDPTKGYPFDTELKSMFPDIIAHIDLSSETAFKKVLEGAAYSELTETGSSILDIVINRDMEGNAISTGIGYEASYHSEDTGFLVSSGVDEQGAYLQIEMDCAGTISDKEALARLEHIYQMLFHGEFDTGCEIGDGINMEKAFITSDPEGAGFTMTIH